MSARMRLSMSSLAALAMASVAAAQVRPAAIGMARPTGGQRGTTVMVSVEGNNLADASAVLFDVEGLTARILKIEDLGPDIPKRNPEDTGPPIQDRARKHKLSVEVSVGKDVPLGRHFFRLLTPLGTTNMVSFIVGALAEAAESEPNDAQAAAQAITLPVTVNGTIEKDDDVDRYRFEAAAGQHLVFDILAGRLGSNLDSILTLLDADGKVVARSDDFRGRTDALLEHTFDRAGTYVLQVADALHGGSPGHFYRLSAGELPYLTGVFPLGLRRGTAATVQLEGYNLGRTTAEVDARSTPSDKDKLPVSPAQQQETFTSQEVVLGDDPEILEREPNDAVHAQPMTIPVTVNGRIDRAGGADEDVFRFHAAKGQTLAFSVLADRAGSRLDSVLEILDARGRPVPRATLRPVWQTSIDLRDHDSNGRGIRLVSWSGLQPGDYVYIDRELARIAELPGHPDADTLFVHFRGRRLAFEGTTPEGHALSTPVYKVEMYPAGATFPPNGMPVFTLFHRNDDGGYMFGKDSHLMFTAPATGDYLLRLRDSRSLSGPEFAYRLHASDPRPDFTLFVNTAAPNVPRGGRVPVYVAVDRRDGFDGPVEVEITGLPAGLQATRGTVPAGANDVTLTLAAADDAPLGTPAPFRVVGRALIGEKKIEHEAMMDAPAPLRVATVVAPPELSLASVEPHVIELPAGGRAKVSVRIRRADGFAGRVPVNVQNLPMGVHVPDIGLNGVLITEQQDARDFYLEANPQTPPSEQTVFLTGRVEVNSSLPTEQASEAIVLKVVPRLTAAGP